MDNNLIYNKLCREILFGPLTQKLDDVQQEQDHSGEYQAKCSEFDLEPYLRRVFDKLYDQLPNYRKAIDAIDHVNMISDDNINFLKTTED